MGATAEGIHRAREDAAGGRQGAEQSGLSGNGIADLAAAINAANASMLGVLSSIASNTAATAANTSQMVGILNSILAKSGSGGSGGGARGRAATPPRASTGAAYRGPGTAMARDAYRGHIMWPDVSAGPVGALGYDPGIITVYHSEESQKRIARAQAQIGGPATQAGSGPLLLGGPAARRGGPSYGGGGGQGFSGRWGFRGFTGNPALNIPPVPGGVGVAAGGGGGGGFGGGGGHRGGGGFGWGGGWRSGGYALSHIARYAGMGELGGLMQLGMSGPVGLAAAIGAGVATGPQLLASVGHTVFGLSQDYRDYTKGMAGYARAGHGTMSDYTGAFVADRGNIPDWMLRTGTGPMDALSILNEYGVVPQEGLEAKYNVANIAEAGLMPGLSGLKRSGYVGFAGRMTSMGVAPSSMLEAGTGGYTKGGATLQSLNTALERAVTLGVDRSQVMRSIETGVQLQARGGALAIDYNQSQDFITRMMSGGSPASRTGQLAQDMIGGVNNAIDTAPSSPTRNLMMYRMIGKYGSTEGVQRLLGKDLYAKTMADTAGRKQIEDFISLAHKSPMLAYTNFQGILKTAGTDRATAAFSEQLQQMGIDPNTPEGRSILSSQLGVTPQALDNQQFNQLPPEAAALPHGAGTYDSTKEASYRTALKNMGVSNSQAASLMNYGKYYKINPVDAGAYMMEESGGDANSTGVPVASRGGGRAKGLFQIMPEEWANMGGGNPYDADTNIDHGMRLLTNKRKQFGGDIGNGMIRMVGDPTSQEARHAAHRMGQFLTKANVPYDVLAGEAKDKGAQMNASQVSFNELSGAAMMFNQGSISFVGAVDKLLEFLRGRAPGVGVDGGVNPYAGTMQLR